MKVKTLKRHVHIHAPAQKVWKVLFDNNNFQIWASEFSEGTKVEGDWELGSKIVFTDKSNYGIFGRVIENVPYETMVIEYDGEIANGKEDTESESAKATKGTHEGYFLAEGDGITHLDIAVEMIDTHFDEMEKAWDKALEKIAALSETLY